MIVFVHFATHFLMPQYLFYLIIFSSIYIDGKVKKSTRKAENVI